ncbi:MAG: hypothetical protein JSR39_09430 [Verrucomicrobia bacterium]|nr:hypothetical protein [Verrucomicrobiota bacterium]
MFPVTVGSRTHFDPSIQASPVVDPHAHASAAVQDSIAAADLEPSIPVVIDRPTLTPPSFRRDTPPPANPPSLSELRFLAAMESFRSFGDEVLLTLGVRLEAFRLQLQDISADNLQKLKEAAENAKASDFWSLLKKVANSLLSALSIVIGVSLVSTGAGSLVGGAMIASGIFSIANMLMSESGTWDWVAKKLANEDEDRRKMLAMLLPTATGLLAGIIGLGGSAGAFAWSGIEFAEKAVMIAQATLAIFDGATTIGKGYADANLIWSQADLTKVKSQMTVERQLIDNTTKSIEGVLDGLNAAHDKANLFVKMAIRSNEAVVKELLS